MIRLRKTLSLIVVICLLLSALPTWAAGLSDPAPAPAAEKISAEPEAPAPEIKPDDPEPLRQIYSGTCGADGDNLTWTLDTETGVLQISGTGAMKDYSSSSAVPWYSYRSYVKSAIINGGVTSIGGCAFSGCSSLTSVTIGNGVTSIGFAAFDGCSSLTSITIGNSVTSIGIYAFSDCSSLTSVTIGNSVTSIGYSAFYGCNSLTEIKVDSANPNYKDINGVLFNKDGTTLIRFPAGKSGEYMIPDGVTSIGNYAFSNCTSLTSVTIPDSVTSIGEGAFSGCSSLTSVTIPDSLTSIGNNAFYNCSSLTSVTIPDSVTSIGEWAFRDCSSLTSVTIPDGVTSIGESAFYNCTSLTSVTIGNGVTSIGYSAFGSCTALTSVTIPDSVTSIGNSAFFNCSSLTSATILGAPPASFGSYVFYGCASGFTIYYTAAHASEWSPNGETTWNGYPIQMIADPQPQIPVGDANGDGVIAFADVAELYSLIFAGSAFTPAQQQILDVNGDGSVSFADVAALYNYVLTGQTA